MIEGSDKWEGGGGHTPSTNSITGITSFIKVGPGLFACFAQGSTPKPDPQTCISACYRP